MKDRERLEQLEREVAELKARLEEVEELAQRLANLHDRVTVPAPPSDGV